MRRNSNLSRMSLACIASLTIIATTACRSEYKRYCDRGKELVTEERYDEAIAQYQLAVKAAPQEPGAYYRIGKILKRQLKLDEAIKYYRKALEVNPDYVDVYPALARVLVLKSQFDEATKLVNDALEMTSVKQDMKVERDLRQALVEIDKARKGKPIKRPSPPAAGPKPAPARATSSTQPTAPRPPATATPKGKP